MADPSYHLEDFVIKEASVNFKAPPAPPEVLRTPALDHVLGNGSIATSCVEAVVETDSGSGGPQIAGEFGGSTASGADLTLYQDGETTVGRADHGIAADCDEPWSAEARRMANAIAERTTSSSRPRSSLRAVRRTTPSRAAIC